MMPTKLRLVRILQGLRQFELAEKVDLSTAYLSAIESGRTTPPDLIAERIAETLGVEVRWLFEERR